MKILIAEDDDVSRKVLQVTLEKAGHEVVAAPGGVEAWESFDQDPLRVVVSDWMMPVLDGLELCKRVRARPGTAYTYFILLTARTGRENYRHAMDAGVDDFLTKPLERDELSIRLHVAQRILGFASRIKQLEDLLPICSYCKKIRDEQQNWDPIEHYISKHTDSSFSHGICPECYEVHVKPMMAKLRKSGTGKDPSRG